MPEHTINFAARFEYLSANESQWKEVMISLRKKTLPAYMQCLESGAESTAMQTWSGLTAGRERGGLEELKRLALAVETWAQEFGFLDVWLKDVALQTMHSWAQGKAKKKWTYFPGELVIPKLQIDLGHWFPVRGFAGYAEWTEFKRLADKKYRRELAAYRATVKKQWGVGSPSLRQHAVWTVRYQRGRSPEAIQTHHLFTTGNTVSGANILKSVHEFAANAGLTIRAGKAGRKKNTTSSRTL